MSAGILQGVPATTLDVDLWIDLPPRQYIRISNLSRKLGAEMVSNTVVVLDNETTVNFVYHVDGLRSFDYEFRRAKWMEWYGQRVAVLPLERIIRSKETVGRPKDLAQLPALRQTLRLTRRLRRR